MSQPSSFFREPPNVAHEFMETIVIGPKSHVPTDDIETKPTLTLLKMFGSKPGTIFADGSEKDIAYAMPAGPPGDYGEFRDANIMLLHTKSKYRAFTIGLPYGVQAKPYGWEDIRKYPWTTWTGYDEPSIGYLSAIGHLLNYWHFRRTEKTIEQIYLHGMTGSAQPQGEIMKNDLLIWLGADTESQSLRDCYLVTYLIKRNAKPIGRAPLHLTCYYAMGFAVTHPRVCRQQ